VKSLNTEEKTMRKTTFTVLAAACATALLAGCGSGGSPDAEPAEAEEAGITIGIKFDQPGLGFKDGDTFKGFDVDVATYVAGELGFTPDQITFKETPSAQRETMLGNGQVDMIFATYSITDSRKESVDFAGPYFVAGQDLLVPVDNTDITGPESLNGRNLCSVSGSTPAEKVKTDYAGDVNLMELPGYAECVSNMDGGQIEAVTTDDIILAGLAAAEGNKGKFKVVGKPFSEEKYGVGLPKGSTEICEKVNAAITKMIESGEWQKALDSNLDGSGYVANDQNPPTPEPCA
jgi:glutamate transport system substrate-binding protein